ncbi:hypothetical protein ACRS5L_21490 [Metapseudomonas otitidis]|uniref:PA0061/PA0062 family lipoprotein n=1 Tax=Metapseudomonas otitidis TaxID=319939 RepID=UPI003EE3CDB6
MHKPALLLLLASLGACASPLPTPDPNQAWVELRSDPGTMLMANRQDGERTRDGRFYQLSPGAHELETRFQFDIPGGGGFNTSSGPTQLTCHIRFRYDGFAAGQRYRLEARPVVMSAQALLRDAQGQVVARGDVLGCGPL